MSNEVSIKLGIVDSDADNVVVCETCHTVVVQDMGRPIDVEIAALEVRSHLSTPIVSTTVDMDHEILTVNMHTNTSRPGLLLEKRFTD